MIKITIGARGSKLSLAYVAKVKELLLRKNSELTEENIDFKEIKTSGLGFTARTWGPPKNPFTSVSVAAAFALASHNFGKSNLVTSMPGSCK